MYQSDGFDPHQVEDVFIKVARMILNKIEDGAAEDPLGETPFVKFPIKWVKTLVCEGTLVLVYLSM